MFLCLLEVTPLGQEFRTNNKAYRPLTK